MKIKINGLDEINSFIKNAGNLLNTSKFYGPVSIIMLTSIKRNFLNKKNRDGSPWAPLKFRKGQPLRKTSRLMNSTANSFDNKQAISGTNLKYARIHMDGANFKPTKKSILKNISFAKIIKIPARETIFLNKKGEEDIQKLTTDILDKI